MEFRLRKWSVLLILATIIVIGLSYVGAKVWLSHHVTGCSFTLQHDDQGAPLADCEGKIVNLVSDSRGTDGAATYRVRLQNEHDISVVIPGGLTVCDGGYDSFWATNGTNVQLRGSVINAHKVDICYRGSYIKVVK